VSSPHPRYPASRADPPIPVPRPRATPTNRHGQRTGDGRLDHASRCQQATASRSTNTSPPASVAPMPHRRARLPAEPARPAQAARRQPRRRCPGLTTAPAPRRRTETHLAAIAQPAASTLAPLLLRRSLEDVQAGHPLGRHNERTTSRRAARPAATAVAGAASAERTTAQYRDRGEGHQPESADTARLYPGAAVTVGIDRRRATTRPPNGTHSPRSASSALSRYLSHPRADAGQQCSVSLPLAVWIDGAVCWWRRRRRVAITSTSAAALDRNIGTSISLAG
jgi:hypothetical protein